MEPATEPGTHEPGGSKAPAGPTPQYRAFAVLAGLATLGLAVVLLAGWPELGAAQRATRASFADEVEGAGLRTALLIDCVFIAAYVAFGFAVSRLIHEPDPPFRPHPGAVAGFILVMLGGVGDVVENGILYFALDDPSAPQNLGAMRAAGLVKWSALGAALLVMVVLLVGRVWRPRPRPNPPTDRPEGQNWDPPPLRSEATDRPRGEGEGTAADDPRIGICLSGGGVRSAAFCLGAMQALSAKKVLNRARYVTAASGGGYFAAGWAVSTAGPPKDAAGPTADRWSPGSPEERWFRDHASYLVPNTKGGAIGVARLVGGIVVNVVVIWLVLFAVARPVGWAIHAIHPELRAGNAVFVRDALGEMAIDDELGPPTVIDDEHDQRVERYEVDLVATADARSNEVCVDAAPYASRDRDRCYPVKQRRPGLVEVRAGRGEVVRQPLVSVVAPVACAKDDDDCDPASSFTVTRHPKIRLVTSFVATTEEVKSALAMGDQTHVRSESGLAGVGYPTFEWWMWELSLGLLTAALAVALLGTMARLGVRAHGVIRALAGALVGAGLLAFAITVALPWLSVWIPRTIAHTFGSVPNASEVESPSGSGVTDYLLPGGGFLAIALAAARQLLSGGRQGGGAGPSKPWYGRVFGWLRGASTQLKWYESSPTKVVLGILAPVVAIVLFVGQLQYASANGWTGRLMGFAFVRDYLPYPLWAPEWAKLAIVVAGLAVFWRLVDAHAWSLYPFYKRRLSEAFILRRTSGDRAEPVDYDTFLPFTAPGGGTDGWSGLPEPGDGKGPQLVLCCSVNLSEYGAVPPGRRAASFTFSSTEIGGPVVQYATPRDYARLPKQRRRDLTVPSAMAISGAAFSPAMGKFNLGPVGTLLALANLRLGVWLPNPCWIKDPDHQSEREWRWLRPGWPWFLRELTNKYNLGRRYLYVSDGGHWDNLGLVELLRRGCTEIYCVSCAGDGPDSFGTIGEAIALAREELGVEIILDPSPLRSPVGKAGPGRQLRRASAKDKPVPFATKRAVAGTFTYTRSPEAAPGRIFYVEADLTENMPFDVHTFAEDEPIFPDDSTGDQVFNHRQFESYRRLGYHQAEAMGRRPAGLSRGALEGEGLPPQRADSSGS